MSRPGMSTTKLWSFLLSATVTLSESFGFCTNTVSSAEGATVNEGTVKSPSPDTCTVAVVVRPPTSSTVTSNGKLESSVQLLAGV